MNTNNKNYIVVLVSISMFFFASNYSFASTKEYMCTKTSNTPFRNGPGQQFPIIAKIIAVGYPVLVIHRVDNWIAIEDVNKNPYWVSSLNLVKKCGGMVVTSEQFVSFKSRPSYTSITLLRLKNNFIFREAKCFENKWCRGEIDNKVGWIEKKYLWGV